MGSQTGINLSHTKQDKTIKGKMYVQPNNESPNGNCPPLKTLKAVDLNPLENLNFFRRKGVLVMLYYDGCWDGGMLEILVMFGKQSNFPGITQHLHLSGSQL